MKIEAKVVRIYKSKDQYGKNPRFVPKGQPLILDGYPKNEDQTKIYFGKPPKSILDSLNIRKAIGKVKLNQLVGKRSRLQPDDQVYKAIRKKQDLSLYNWYIIISIQREIEIPNNAVNDEKYMWLDSNQAKDIEEKILKDLSFKIDVISTNLSIIMGRGFFSGIFIDDFIFFSRPSHETFSLTNNKLTLEASLIRPARSLKLKRVEQFLKGKSKLENNQKNLKSVIHWYLASLREKDNWKRFMWGFLALEIMTHKLAPKLYDDVLNNLRFENINDKIKQSISPEPIREMINSIEQQTLTGKFTILALALYPVQAPEDVNEFKIAKTARDKLSHGSVKEDSELPVGSVNYLLTKYMTKLCTDLTFN